MYTICGDKILPYADRGIAVNIDRRDALLIRHWEDNQSGIHNLVVVNQFTVGAEWQAGGVVELYVYVYVYVLYICISKQKTGHKKKLQIVYVICP